MAENETEAEPQGGSKKKMILTIVVVLVVMLVEGGAVFVATKFISGGPLDAVAVEGGAEEGTPAGELEGEVPIAEINAPNTKSGRVFVYEIHLAGRVNETDRERVELLIEDHRLTIDDRLNNIIRAAEPQVLKEDGLETLKRQMRLEVNRILGDENLIREVLMPKMMPYRADY